jgi:hypothetical protein
MQMLILKLITKPLHRIINIMYPPNTL